MEKVKHVFIINPAAGKSNRTVPIAGEIAQTAKEAGADYEIFKTEYPRHACLLVQQIAQKYSDIPLRFYACGGDGTLNEVATSATTVKNAAFTHFPSGSGNDFIKAFGNGANQFFNLKALLSGEVMELDYIESDCGISVNIASVGIDARVARDMQKYKRIPGFRGHGAYIASTVENVIRGLHDYYHVEIDGNVLSGRYTLIMAANGICYGGGFYPVPEAELTDGLLDIILVSNVSRFTAAKVLGDYKAGKYADWPQYMSHHKARELTVYTAEKPLTLNLDGEIEETQRVSMRIAKNKMRFVVPKGVKLK